MHPNYQLGIDLGTTWTAASICRDGDARPESVALSTTGAAVASVVFLAPDGTMLTGEPAQRRALSEPARVVREFKRRIGDGTPIVVGGHPVPAEVLSARFVARIVAEVAHREDAPPQSVAVTHPVEWGDHKKRSFAAALAAEGLPDVLFLTEPQAAAVGYASEQRVEGGRTVAVYDLGGGTFDAAVVRKAADGTFALLGHPSGIERLGGVDFDDAVFAHVREAVGAAWDELDPDDPAVRTAVAGLRRECTAAKETLSADTEVMIPVLLPGLHTMVRLGRAEFEDMIRPAVAETVEALRRAVASAAVEPGDLDAVLLVGGSSRIPLVAQMVSAELGRPVAVDADPKSVVAAGAALAARNLQAPAAEAVEEEPAGSPDSPPLAFAAAPSTQGASRRAPRRAGVFAAAGVAVAVAFGLSASLATGIGFGPVAAGAPAGGPAPVPASPAPLVDPWTGDALPGGTPDPGAAAGTPEALTTPAGPRRPQAVAARVRPVARNVPLGAARPAAPAAPVRPAPAPVARPPAPAPGTAGSPGPAGSSGGGTTGGGSGGGTAGGGSTGGGSGGGTTGGSTGGTTGGGTTGGGSTGGGSTSGGGTSGSTGGTSTGGTSGGGSTGGGTTGGGTSGGSTGGGSTGGGTTGSDTTGGDTGGGSGGGSTGGDTGGSTTAGGTTGDTGSGGTTTGDGGSEGATP
ncbi:MAG TPA: Hsp70 family protein [Pseudonocardia sp.]